MRLFGKRDRPQRVTNIQVGDDFIYVDGELTDRELDQLRRIFMGTRSDKTETRA